jgi:cytoskeletal protein CcmA (bactofilin family)
MNAFRTLRSLPGAFVPAVVAAVLAALVFLLWPAPNAAAFDRRTGERVVVPAGQTVNDDVFAAGRSISVDGTVHGDVFAFGESVTVAGIVDGDLIAAGNRIVVDGQVTGSVRAASQYLELNGAVGRNVSVAGQQLDLGRGGRVAGNWLGAGEVLSIDGDVGGSLAAAVHDFNVQGRVGEGAEVAIESISFGPGARIGGDLTYYADHEVTVPAQAVTGRVDYHYTQRAQRHDPAASPAHALRAIGNFFSLTWLAGSAIAGLLVVRLFPRLVASFLHALETRPLPSLGLGVLTLIGTIPVAVIVGITIVGIPLSLLLVAGYFSGLFVGWLLLAAAAGTILIGLVRRGHAGHHSWSFLLGLLVLYAATRIPVAGGLIMFVGTSLGLGALLVATYQLWRSGHPTNAAPAPAPGIAPVSPPSVM